MRLVAAALAVSVGEPRLWALATVGFLARGGIVLFLLPLLVLPTPVGISTFFGADAITVAGPSPRLVVTLVAILLGLAGAVVAAALAGAWADIEGYRLVAADPEATEAAGGPVGDPGAPGFGGVLAVAGLQATALVPAAVALFVSVGGIVEVARGEFLLPSASDVPYLLRVVSGAAEPLARVVALVAVGELLGTLATRCHLVTQAEAAAGGDRRPRGAFAAAIGRLARRPLPTLAAWGFGSAVLVVTLAATLVAVAAGWEQLRLVLLDPAAGGGFPADDPLAAVEWLLATLLAALLAIVFVALWLAAIALTGAASAFRASLVTIQLSRGGRPA